MRQMRQWRQRQSWLRSLPTVTPPVTGTGVGIGTTIGSIAVALWVVLIAISPAAHGQASFTVQTGGNQTVAGGTTVLLSGTVSNPSGVALTVQWTQVRGPRVTLANSNSANASFAAPDGLSNTQLIFRFAATDGTNTSADTTTITVNPDSNAPTANAGPDQSVSAGATVQLHGTSTTPSLSVVNLAWTQLAGPTVTLSDGAIANPTFVAPSSSTTTAFVFELRASSVAGVSVDTTTVHVTGSSGSLSVNAGPDQTVSTEAHVQLNGSVTNPGGGTVSLQWSQTSGPTVTLSNTTILNPTFDAPKLTSNTDLVFQLQATSAGTTASGTGTIHVNPTPTPTPPVIDVSLPDAMLVAFLFVLTALLWALALWL